MDLPLSVLTKQQVRKFTKTYNKGDCKYKHIVNVRHDDQCGNGHNSFSITSDIYRMKNGGHRWLEDRSGCCHDEIREYFPELRHLIKWHLCSSDGPMHYISNTLYHASDKDHWGHYKGQPIKPQLSLYFCDLPLSYNGKLRQADLKRLQELGADYPYSSAQILEYDHGNDGGYEFKPKCSPDFFDADRWDRCAFNTYEDALKFIDALSNFPWEIKTEFTDVGEGKEPDIEAARSSAIWPNASLEQLRDEQALLERLPALMTDFKRDIESMEFVY